MISCSGSSCPLDNRRMSQEISWSKKSCSRPGRLLWVSCYFIINVYIGRKIHISPAEWVIVAGLTFFVGLLFEKKFTISFLHYFLAQPSASRWFLCTQLSNAQMQSHESFAKRTVVHQTQSHKQTWAWSTYMWQTISAWLIHLIIWNLCFPTFSENSVLWFCLIISCCSNCQPSAW